MVPDDYQWLLVVVYAVFPQSHIWKLRLVPFKIYEWIIPFIITPFIWERWISYHRACPPFEDWQERAFTVGIGGPVGSGKILGAAQVSVLWMISMWNKQLIHGIWVDEWVYSLYRFYSFLFLIQGIHICIYIYIKIEMYIQAEQIYWVWRYHWSPKIRIQKDANIWQESTEIGIQWEF